MKKILLGLGTIGMIGIPLVSVVSCNQNISNNTDVQRGKQFLIDYYYNTLGRSSSLSAVLNRQNNDFGIVDSVENIKIDSTIKKGDVQTYSVSLMANSFAKPALTNYKFLVDLNLTNFVQSYPAIATSFSHSFGNPSDSGFDVNFINYLKNGNYENLEKIVKNILNLNNLTVDELPSGLNAIDNSKTGSSGTIFWQNNNFSAQEIQIAYQTQSSVIGFSLYSVFDKQTGKIIVPELFY